MLVKDFYSLLIKKGNVVDVDLITKVCVPLHMVCVSKKCINSHDDTLEKFIRYVYVAADPKKELLVIYSVTVYEYYSKVCKEVVLKPVLQMYESHSIHDCGDYHTTVLNDLNEVSEETLKIIESFENV